MRVLLFIVAGLSALSCFGLLSAFWYSRHLGVLLAAIVCGVSAVAMVCLDSWWPLLVGFLLLWLLRLTGGDPGWR